MAAVHEACMAAARVAHTSSTADSNSDADLDDSAGEYGAPVLLLPFLRAHSKWFNTNAAKQIILGKP